ncbi:MAG: hypothetical protein ACLGIN_01430 [Candidatus Sericytochromatia bacterium]
MRACLTASLLILALTGCAPAVVSGPVPDQKVSLLDYTDPRTVEVLVQAPEAIASSFRLLAASDAFKPVAEAQVRVRTLDDSEVGRKTFVTDEAGLTTFNNIPDGKPLSIVATFESGDKTYQVSTLIAPGKPQGRLVADPITSLIDARVKTVSNRTVNLLSVSESGLSRMYAILDAAGVSVEASALVAGQKLEVLDAVWTREIAKVESAQEKAEITAFIDAIKKDAGSVRTSDPL